MYKAKQINEEYYEIFSVETAETPNGETIEVLKSVGSFKKEELQNSIINLQSQISDIESKIEAIDNIE